MPRLDTAGNAYNYANLLFGSLLNEVIPDKELFKNEYRVSPLVDGSDEFHMPEEIQCDGYWDLTYLPESWSGFKDIDNVPETLVPHENPAIAAFIDKYTLKLNLYYQRGNHVFFHNRLLQAVCEVNVSLLKKVPSILKYAQYTWELRLIIFYNGENHQQNVQTYLRARYQQIVQEEMDRLTKLLKRYPDDLEVKNKIEALRFIMFRAETFKVDDWKFQDNIHYVANYE